MCFGINLNPFSSGGRGREAKALEEQARQTRLLAQANQQSLESQIARQKASEDAKALLDVPMETTDVTVGEQAAAPTLDEATGKRRTTRAKFQFSGASGTSGLGRI